MPQDPYADFQKPASVSNPYAEFQGTATPKPPDQVSLARQAGGVVKDIASGAAKGLAGTVHNGANFIENHVPGMRSLDDAALKLYGAPRLPEEEIQNRLQPTNALQSTGRLGEQAAEFLIPGAAEEKLASLAPSAIRPLARIATRAIGSGTVNASQGGSFGEGAAFGAGGAGVTEGLRAAAPKAAEIALHINPKDRMFGKTPGAAILNETKGVLPGTIARTGQESLSGLNQQLTSAVSGAPGPASLGPARQVISDAMQNANSAARMEQLRPFEEHLAGDPHTGLPRPLQVSPTELLSVKRGLNDVSNLWNRRPDTLPGVIGTARKAYGALDNELDRTVPEAAALNQRTSSLIPVVHHAEQIDREAGLPQRVAMRMGARTGALVGSAIGGEEGYRRNGLPGAIGGATLGLVGPELLADPAAQMVAARVMASPGAQRIAAPLISGAGLQATRKQK